MDERNELANSRVQGVIAVATQKSSSVSRSLFEQGRSCGECVLLASDVVPIPQLDTLLAASRGLAAGRAGMCNVLLTGLMILGVANPDPDPDPRPTNDFLGAFIPPGAPGASDVQRIGKANEFKSRFEAKANELGVDTTCADISGIDWARHDPLAVPDNTYPPAKCVALADAAIEHLKELLESDQA
ncbi:MAG: hypothetical protein HQ478_11745 [Chloroflexi bacterium]|nr:hypothetical protein [Chloroflexota bacterium]